VAATRPTTEGDRKARVGPLAQRLVAVPTLAGDTKERARLLGVERLYLFFPNLGRIREGGRVAGDEVPPNRLLHCPAQHRVDVAHAGGLEPVATLFTGGPK
jgi:hypothetical protein